MNKIDNDLGIASYEFGQWEMFKRISSVYYGKECYFLQDNGTVYSRISSAYCGLCERCLAKGLYTPGKVVHHKIHLTPENISDPRVALGWENLQLLCQDCHAAVHRRKIGNTDEAVDEFLGYHRFVCVT